MKRFIIAAILLMAYFPFANAQTLAVKTNAAGWAAHGTINLSAEVALWPKWTLDLSWGTNPWRWKEQKQTKSWSAGGEIRYWLGCDRFGGGFVGAHGGYAHYNWGMKRYRYDGWLSVAGLSCGYGIPLCGRWSAEANLGLGWIHYEYDKSGRHHYPGDIRIYGSQVSNRFGVTRAGISVIFAIK